MSWSSPFAQVITAPGSRGGASRMTGACPATTGVTDGSACGVTGLTEATDSGGRVRFTGGVGVYAAPPPLGPHPQATTRIAMSVVRMALLGTDCVWNSIPNTGYSGAAVPRV